MRKQLNSAIFHDQLEIMGGIGFVFAISGFLLNRFLIVFNVQLHRFNFIIQPYSIFLDLKILPIDLCVDKAVFLAQLLQVVKMLIETGKKSDITELGRCLFGIAFKELNKTGTMLITQFVSEFFHGFTLANLRNRI